MTFAEKLNLFLLVLNSNFAIVTLFLLFSAFIYVVWQAHEHRMTWSDWAFNVPLGITVAFALSVEGFGNLIIRVTAWAWRLAGGYEPFGSQQLVAIGTGSVIGLCGLLLVIRAISRPRYGEKVWLAAFGCAAINTIVTVYLFLPA